MRIILKRTSRYLSSWYRRSKPVIDRYLPGFARRLLHSSRGEAGGSKAGQVTEMDKAAIQGLTEAVVRVMKDHELTRLHRACHMIYKASPTQAQAHIPEMHYLLATELLRRGKHHITPIEKAASWWSWSINKSPKTAAQMRAQSTVRRAIEGGKIAKPKTCGKCRKKGEVEMSHSDYDKPLDIQWLCRSCHSKRDAANPKGGTVSKEGDWSAEVSFLKRDDSKRLVYGVVLEPGDPKHTDAQKDWLKAEEIEPAAHDYLKRYYAGKAAMGLQHEQLALDTIPVESYIAPADFKLGAKLVKKGSWVMVSYVGDDATWEKVTKGEITGYSIGGRGERHVS